MYNERSIFGYNRQCNKLYLWYCQQHSIMMNKDKLYYLLYCCYGLVLARYCVRLTDYQPVSILYSPYFLIDNNNMTLAKAQQFAGECDHRVLKYIHKALNILED